MLAGTRFGQYELIKRIATGGMAEIHLAKTRGIGGFEKLLALKVIHPKFAEDQDFIDMLIDEAKIAVQLNHNNVGQVFDLGKIDDTYYIAMEFIDGKDLYQLLVKCAERDISIPFDLIAFITMEVAAGLQYAHARRDNYGRELNLIHRDISPQNVLLSYDGEVKIVDFGIAKASQRSRETESGVIKGKFFYMSPEQAWGDPIDSRTDIFSLGICLYEMITGEMLYHEEKALVLLDKVRKAEIPPMRARRPDLPGALQQIALKALARDRDQRYQTGGQLQGELTGFVFSNWPSFNRSRLADFMRGVFGDQRFVMPIPEPTPAPTPAHAELEQRGQHAAQMMSAADFTSSEGSSVIFDVNQHDRLRQAAAQAVGESPAPATEEDDSTIAGAYYPGDDPEYAAAAANLDDDGDDRTILEPVWSSPPDLDGDDDATAVIDLAAVRPPAPEDGEQRTNIYHGPGQSPPKRLNRPVTRQPPGAPIGSALSESTDDLTMERPASVPIERPSRNVAPVRAAPRPPPPSPQRAPRTDPPGPRRPPASKRTTQAPPAPPKRANRAAEGARKTLARMPRVRARRGPLSRLGRWAITATGVSTIALVVLLVYVIVGLLPAMFADERVATRAVVINSTPAGAQVRLDGTDTGKKTPARVDGLQTGTNHTVTLEMEGFEPYSESFTLTASEGEKKVRGFLQKLRGRLEIQTLPSGAEVYLDGKYIGDTPTTKDDIDRDKNEVMLILRKPGYVEERKVVSWGDDVSLELSFKLRTGAR